MLKDFAKDPDSDLTGRAVLPPVNCSGAEPDEDDEFDF